MSTPPHTDGTAAHREGAEVGRDELPSEDANNVAGRRLSGPSQGFGQLWRKRFWMVFPSDTAPETVISTWKRHFSDFWPGKSDFVIERMAEQEVASAELELPLGARVATGLVVLTSAPERFTLMTVDGHMFAGWVTFCAQRTPDGTRIEVELLMRASDPLYELGLAFGGHKREEQFWRDTLARVAAYFGESPVIQMESTREERGRQWSRVVNTWHNAVIRTQFQRAGDALGRVLRRSSR